MTVVVALAWDKSGEKNLSEVVSSVCDALGLNPQPCAALLCIPPAFLPKSCNDLTPLDEFGTGIFLSSSSSHPLLHLLLLKLITKHLFIRNAAFFSIVWRDKFILLLRVTFFFLGLRSRHFFAFLFIYFFIMVCLIQSDFPCVMSIWEYFCSASP